ncbi:MAG: cobyrinate a,c-diamide synthase [Gammaproteobacteria bacterium]|nr:cobyrinate a,c-diamide synthase [Gammaproteobacteria bacterium]
MSHVLISAAHKSSGKTTISIGLCAALTTSGLNIQPFKKGPDYIDPMWLAKAAGHACHNLDFNTMEREEIHSTFYHYSQGADISIIEGNKGLYDGLDLHGTNSNAALASLLCAPVILVIDARGMTRGIAPLILGYQAFSPTINIAGVILNQLGGSRHESKLRSVIGHYTDVPVIGAVHHNTELKILERHLGLIPSNEMDETLQRITIAGQYIKQQVEMDKVIEIAHQAKTHERNMVLTSALLQKNHYSSDGSNRQYNDKTNNGFKRSRCRIGIARDAAFGFYYPGDLEAFQQAGATLVYFDTLNDNRLPNVDGLFLGGGFPETKMQALTKNRKLRHAISSAIEAGLPVYAECGGLMYLTRSIQWNGETCEMVGVIPADTILHKKPVGRGYVRLQETSDHPWPSDPAAEFAAHEFHYSSLENVAENLNFAYRVLRGEGINGTQDGIVYKNLLGCYAHLRDVHHNHWVQRFVDFVLSCKDSQKISIANINC